MRHQVHLRPRGRHLCPVGRGQVRVTHRRQMRAVRCTRGCPTSTSGGHPGTSPSIAISHCYAFLFSPFCTSSCYILRLLALPVDMNPHSCMRWQLDNESSDNVKREGSILKAICTEYYIHIYNRSWSKFKQSVHLFSIRKRSMMNVIDSSHSIYFFLNKIPSSSLVYEEKSMIRRVLS